MSAANENSEEVNNSRPQCPVCLGNLLPPVYQCQNGHLLGKECIDKLEKCPVCRKNLLSTGRIRNLVIEDLISKEIYPCDYSEEGCDVKLRGDAIETHTNRCVYA